MLKCFRHGHPGSGRKCMVPKKPVFPARHIQFPALSFPALPAPWMGINRFLRFPLLQDSARPRCWDSDGYIWNKPPYGPSDSIFPPDYGRQGLDG